MSLEDNSALAVMRAAIMVAVADSEFDGGEAARVEVVYKDICTGLGHDDVSEWRLDECTAFAAEVRDEVKSAIEGGQLTEYIGRCAEAITDRDLQELAVLAALRIAGGDYELASEESGTLLKLCDYWDIKLRDVIKPYLGSDRGRIWLDNS